MLKKTKKQHEAIKLLVSEAISILLYGGSRSGKTAIFFYSMMIRAIKAPGSRHLIIRKHFKHVKTGVWHDTYPKIKGLAWPDMPVKENKQDWYLELPNGSQIWIGGLDDKERADKILGTEYATIWFNECSELSYASVQVAITRLAQKTTLKNKLYYDCNPPNKKHWSHKLFIENKDPETDEAKDASKYASMLMNPKDNEENLAEGYIENILSGLSLRQRQRFELGEWLDDIDGALWKLELINNFRVEKTPPLVRVVVGVDPAGSTNKKSDNTGIVAAGKDVSGNVYILEDVSGKYTPNEWAMKSIALHNKWKANYIVAEKNQGGDMVKNTIHTLERGIKVEPIHAKSGKFLRAEPVQALYEQGMVHHCGLHIDLENEMCSWIPGETKDSPDRVDAMVYAVSELALKHKTTPFFGYL